MAIWYEVGFRPPHGPGAGKYQAMACVLADDFNDACDVCRPALVNNLLAAGCRPVQAIIYEGHSVFHAVPVSARNVEPLRATITLPPVAQVVVFETGECGQVTVRKS